MNKQGFTLAEVLITLGIIGVVAAMTIPTLITNTNGSQFKTAYKKTLSMLNQAVLMNVALDDYDFSNLDAEDADSTKKMSDLLGARMQSATSIGTTDDYFNTTNGVGSAGVNLGTLELTVTCTQADVDNENMTLCTAAADVGKEKTGSIASTAFTASNSKVYQFADGTAFGYYNDIAKCNAKGKSVCLGFIDVNGKTAPNEVVACDDDTATTCEVSSNNVKDIFPVFLYGQTVEPATPSAKAVLLGK